MYGEYEDYQELERHGGLFADTHYTGYNCEHLCSRDDRDVAFTESVEDFIRLVRLGGIEGISFDDYNIVRNFVKKSLEKHPILRENLLTRMLQSSILVT